LNIESLNISGYTYILPEKCIARYPLRERDMSRLLVFAGGNISEDIFSRLPDYIDSDDMLVFNNTRVIRARIEMEKETGARIEIFCLEPYEPADYAVSFAQRESCRWKCMVGNLKKWKSGVLKKQMVLDGKTIDLFAEKQEITPHYTVIRFRWTGNADFGTLLDAMGQMPIPPYLNRKSEMIDEIRYQTIYSKYKGSVAAPTAGLHFSPQILQSLSAQGTSLEEITLHVGAGTFRPIQQDMVGEHRMHAETFSIRRDFIRKLLDCKGRLTAVGTTSLRALESAYWLGVKFMQPDTLQRLELQQWEACELPQNISARDAFLHLEAAMNAAKLDVLHASTRIMIVPGYKFRVCKRLITNFHQPQSTLLLLVAAATGDQWQNIYRYAMNNGFRFLSYGDSSLLDIVQ
jgi:S-adenosylmethionine:tRNA ribosyltransferase-isomerase